MATSTVNYLKTIMPGQPEAWYDRIASDIHCGKMPLPMVEGVPLPAGTIAPPPPPTKVNPARQRFTEGIHRRNSPKPLVTTKPVANTPNTVGEALQQARQKPKRPAQPASAATKWELERLVHSDKNTAERLAAQVAFANPDKSEQWCWEKAIFDLERDRG
jgi:hypothetical protein